MKHTQRVHAALPIEHGLRTGQYRHNAEKAPVREVRRRRMSALMALVAGGLLAAAVLEMAGCGAKQDNGGYFGAAKTPQSAALAMPAIAGTVTNAGLPVANAEVYVLQASAEGYGAASTSLLDGASGNAALVKDTVASDATYGMAAVETDGQGRFALEAGVTCSEGQPVYVYAAKRGTGVPQVAMLGVCGAQGFSAQGVAVNGASTTAFTQAMAAFTRDGLHVGSPATELGEMESAALRGVEGHLAQ